MNFNIMTSLRNIENLCRLCIKNSHSYSCIYEKYMLNNSLLFEVINDVCQLDMHADDGLPEYICYECHIKIVEFTEFKNRSHECKAIFPCLKEKLQKQVNVQTEEGNGIFSRGVEEEDPNGYIYQVKTEEMSADTSLSYLKSVELVHSKDPNGIYAKVDVENDPDITDIPLSNSRCAEEVQVDVSNGISYEADISPLMLEPDESEIDKPQEETLNEQINELSNAAASILCSNPAGLFLNDKEAEIPSGTFLLAGEHGNKFKKICNSKRHKIVHNGENPPICDENGMLVQDRKYLKKHKIECRGKKALVFNDCSKKYTHSSTVKIHTRMRNGRKASVCDKCGKRFAHKGNLQSHLRTHSGEKPFVCGECKKCFTQKGSLKIHMRVHNGEKPFACAECNKRFTRKGSLDIHLRVHSGEKAFICVECGKCFAHKLTLENHLRMHSGEKPFVCDKCGKSFTRKGSLENHRRMHSGEKPFLCVECGMCFNRKGSLKIHFRVHSGEKPFVCVECNKCFTRKENFDSHMRVHNGEKPFVCDKCGKCFSRKGNLDSHIRIHR